jgi:apolipoprotein N-acyltransferase
VVQTPFGRLATVICFDADFPALMRQVGKASADILLVPANDWQPVAAVHAHVATFRAVENGVSLVRATGNGLTIAVDSLGQTLAAADYFDTEKLTLVVDVPTEGQWTLYARTGDLFAFLCIGALAGAAIFGVLRRVRTPRVAEGGTVPV